MKKYLLLSLLFILNCGFVKAQEGYYLEIKSHYGSVPMEIKSWVQKGEYRVETTPTNSGTVTMLGKLNLRDSMYMLDEKHKTYSIIPRDKKNEKMVANAKLELIGKDKVDKFNCVHVKIRSKALGVIIDAWVTKDIPFYKELILPNAEFFGSPELYKLLKSKNVDGFLAKIIVTDGKSAAITMELTKAVKSKINPDLFSLAGYKNSGKSDAKVEAILNAISNLKPEQQHEILQRLRETYGE